MRNQGIVRGVIAAGGIPEHGVGGGDGRAQARLRVKLDLFEVMR